MNAGLASGAPEVLYSVQNYHKRAMDAIKSPTPNVNCDVILIRPQMAEHEFGQQNNDYKWKEVCIIDFISILQKEERREIYVLYTGKFSPVLFSSLLPLLLQRQNNPLNDEKIFQSKYLELSQQSPFC